MFRFRAAQEEADEPSSIDRSNDERRVRTGNGAGRRHRTGRRRGVGGALLEAEREVCQREATAEPLLRDHARGLGWWRAARDGL